MAEDKVHGLLSSATWGGALLGGVGALTVTEWLAMGGFLLALAGFCVNTWHKITMVRLRKREMAIAEEASHDPSP